MCRLFTFRSVIRSRVHRSLVEAENALGTQSTRHPDGWGVAYYIDGAPHLTRSPATAVADHLFHRLSGVVSSETVVAHVRKATHGDNSVLNCHPFQFGRWVFAHNGDIPNFHEIREELMGDICEHLRPFVLGETDSEAIFFLLLSELGMKVSGGCSPSATEVMSAMRRVVAKVKALSPGTPEKPLFLTMVLTDGELMVALQGGKELRFSTHKTRCSDRDTCSFLAPECEAATDTGKVNHLLLSSEIIHGENVWTDLQPGEMIGVDRDMNLLRAEIDRYALPVAG
jgi:glutamine amidotransferase